MDFKDFYLEIKNCLSHWRLMAEIRNTVVAFTGSRNWSVDDNSKCPAPASINTATKSIVFNNQLIASNLYDLRFELKLVDSKDTFSSWRHMELVCKCIKTFLLLHEIGHWLYSAPPSEVIPVAKQYCKGVPLELCMYLNNVVEDSVIQRLFMLDYRGSFYRQCFNIGICCLQGAEAVKTYVANAEAQNWSIRTKLFYFIIRAYNLHNSEVQAMFNIPDKIGWKEDTIEAFDQAIIIIDKVDRVKYVFEVLAPLVFRDLHEVVDGSDLESADSNDSLLDQDKLYTSNSSKSKGSSGSSSTSSGKGSSSSSGNSSEESGDNSNDETSEETSGDSSSNSSNESNEESSDSSNGDSNEESNEESNDSSNEESSESDSEGDSDGSSNEDNSDEDSDGDNSSEESKSSSNSNEPLPEVKPEAPEVSIREQIIEACKELNKSINASNEPSEISEAPKLKSQLDGTAISCSVRDHTHESDSTSTSSMNKLTLNIYGNALGVLDKIFTMSNSTIRGLDQGELDEDELYTYYTEKNLNIYKEENKVKQDKKVVVYFILDNSGSMDGDRFNYSSAAFIGLIHALEDIQIKCCLLSFGEHTRLIKSFNDPCSFLGIDSSLQHRVNQYVSNLEGDTNLFPALDFVTADEYFLSTDPDLCKVVIVATDGCTNKEKECAYVAEQISKEALMFGVGLDMEGQEEYLKRVMPGAIIKNYNGSNIATQLPEDIYEEIINRFLLY